MCGGNSSDEFCLCGHIQDKFLACGLFDAPCNSCRICDAFSGAPRCGVALESHGQERSDSGRFPGIFYFSAIGYSGVSDHPVLPDGGSSREAGSREPGSTLRTMVGESGNCRLPWILVALYY